MTLPEAVEGVGRLAVGQARVGVSHFEHRLVTEVSGRHRHLTSYRGERDDVAQQVEHHLVQPIGIPLHPRRTAAHGHLHTGFGCGGAHQGDGSLGDGGKGRPAWSSG